MIVKIISLSEGLEIIKDVVAIRIKSFDYNLLIMKDYVPIIGHIDGLLEIETKNKTIKKENIVAYYINNNNEFKIIMKE